MTLSDMADHVVELIGSATSIVGSLFSARGSCEWAWAIFQLSSATPVAQESFSATASGRVKS
jgi:hypothetical protein